MKTLREPIKLLYHENLNRSKLAKELEQERIHFDRGCGPDKIRIMKQY